MIKISPIKKENVLMEIKCPYCGVPIQYDEIYVQMVGVPTPFTCVNPFCAEDFIGGDVNGEEEKL